MKKNFEDMRKEIEDLKKGASRTKLTHRKFGKKIT